MKIFNVGYQRFIKGSKVKSRPLFKIWDEMLNDEELRKLTDHVRASESDDERRKAKELLPAVIISADTKQRKVSTEDKRTGLIYIDLDLKDHPDTDLRATVEDMQYPWLIGYHVSPSGGLKVLCSIEPDEKTHLRSFMALDKVFGEHGLTVDQACKDLKRVSYLCHDPGINETLIQPFKKWDGEPITPIPEVKRKAYKHEPSSSDLSPDDEAALCLQYLDPDMDYHEWLKVGMALHAHGVSLAIWDDWSSRGTSYKKGECERKWKTFSGDSVKFGTVVNMATRANGNKNPITATMNQQLPTLDVDEDLEDLDEDRDEELQIFYYKKQFWMLDEKKEKYIGLTETVATRRLRAMGFSSSSKHGMSEVDRLKDHAVFRNTIDFASPIAGRSIGLLIDENGRKFLISSKNKRVQAKPGEWNTIRAILEGMLGDQVDYFHAWMHVARKQLNSEHYTQGHVLALAGQPNCGKSLTANKIIKPLLGSIADPTRYLTGKTEFNSDLVAAELLLMDDKGGKRTSDARMTLAHNLKDIAAGSHTVSCHPKGKDSFTVSPLWRLVICLNDDDQSLGAFPNLGEGDSDSIGDKVLLLKCFNDTPLPYAQDPEKYSRLGGAIKRDLAAYAHHLDSYQIPEYLMTMNTRFGFNEYHHPDLLEIINQNTNERTLLSATDDILFGDTIEEPLQLDASTQRYYWVGKAEQWSKVLRNAKWHPQSKTINNELGYGITSKKAGRIIAKVAKVADGRVLQDTSVRGIRQWRIWAPIDEVEIDGDPF